MLPGGCLFLAGVRGACPPMRLGLCHSPDRCACASPWQAPTIFSSALDGVPQGTRANGVHAERSLTCGVCVSRPTMRGIVPRSQGTSDRGREAGAGERAAAPGQPGPRGLTADIPVMAPGLLRPSPWQAPTQGHIAAGAVGDRRRHHQLSVPIGLSESGYSPWRAPQEESHGKLLIRCPTRCVPTDRPRQKVHRRQRCEVRGIPSKRLRPVHGGLLALVCETPDRAQLAAEKAAALVMRLPAMKEMCQGYGAMPTHCQAHPTRDSVRDQRPTL